MHTYLFYKTVLLLNKVATSHTAPLPMFFVICALTVFSSPSSAPVYAASPYESGYDHGCDDAKIPDYSGRYINQPGKGPSSHTDEFMQGYYYGNGDCSESSGDGEDVDRERSTGPKEKDRGLQLIVGLSFDLSALPSNYDGLYFSINGVEQKSHMEIRHAIYPKEDEIDTYFERAYHFAENSVEAGESVEVCAIIKDNSYSYIDETCKIVINGDESEPERVEFSFPS